MSAYLVQPWFDPICVGFRVPKKQRLVCVHRARTRTEGMELAPETTLIFFFPLFRLRSDSAQVIHDNIVLPIKTNSQDAVLPRSADAKDNSQRSWVSTVRVRPHFRYIQIGTNWNFVRPSLVPDKEINGDATSLWRELPVACSQLLSAVVRPREMPVQIHNRAACNPYLWRRVLPWRYVASLVSKTVRGRKRTVPRIPAVRVPLRLSGHEGTLNHVHRDPAGTVGGGQKRLERRKTPRNLLLEGWNGP
ncbi:hypothetical protein C8R45DRAFT_258452 [Mycena sanguinolenta]|nr:hypothetical protein C8R45DRAFT_258452 [Mycena sanguinolenta]